VASGKVPEEVRPWICGADLTGIPKKGPPGSIRPIAAGNTIRRWVAKCFCSIHKAEWAEELCPWQVGVAVRGGAEGLIHYVRQVWEEKREDPDFVIMKLDMKNAYNRCNREIFFKWVCKYYPDMARFVYLTYGEDSNLVHGDWVILSQEGTQQGDGLASILFVACLRKAYKELLRRHPDLELNNWFIDDGVIAGPSKVVADAFDTIMELFPDFGLDPNPAKCQLCWPCEMRKGEDYFDEEIEVYPGTGMDILGAPIGDKVHCEAFLKEKLERVEALFTELVELENLHVALVLLRQCASFCRMVHYIRTCPYLLQEEGVKRFDERVRGVLSEMVGDSVVGISWDRAGMSVRAGGLGPRHANKHAGGAYLASHYLSGQIFNLKEDTQHLQDARDHVNERVAEEDKVEVGTELGQRDISISIDAQESAVILGKLDPPDRGRLVSMYAPHAGAFLLGAPNPFHGTELRASEVRVALKVRLGMSVFLGGRCPEGTCQEWSDEKGAHAMCCRCGGDLCSRHNALAKVFYEECKVASLQPVLELCHPDPLSIDRPGDVVVPAFDGKGRTAFDVACTSSTQFRFLGLAQNTVLSAAEEYDRVVKGKVLEKVKGYVNYVSLVCENMGGWTKKAQTVFKTVTNMAADRVGMDRAKRSHLFYQKMSVALWRSNARAIQVRGPALGKETVEGVDFRKEDWNGPQVVASWVKSMIKSGSLIEDYEEGEIIEEVVPLPRDSEFINNKQDREGVWG